MTEMTEGHIFIDLENMIHVLNCTKFILLFQFIKNNAEKLVKTKIEWKSFYVAVTLKFAKSNEWLLGDISNLGIEVDIFPNPWDKKEVADKALQDRIANISKKGKDNQVIVMVSNDNDFNICFKEYLHCSNNILILFRDKPNENMQEWINSDRIFNINSSDLLFSNSKKLFLSNIPKDWSDEQVKDLLNIGPKQEPIVRLYKNTVNTSATVTFRETYLIHKHVNKTFREHIKIEYYTPSKHDNIIEIANLREKVVASMNKKKKEIIPKNNEVKLQSMKSKICNEAFTKAKRSGKTQKEALKERKLAWDKFKKEQVRHLIKIPKRKEKLNNSFRSSGSSSALETPCYSSALEIPSSSSAFNSRLFSPPLESFHSFTGKK